MLTSEHETAVLRLCSTQSVRMSSTLLLGQDQLKPVNISRVFIFLCFRVALLKDILQHVSSLLYLHFTEPERLEVILWYNKEFRKSTC